MEEERLQKRNNKPLLIVLLVAVFGLIGGTLAYYVSRDVYTNEFETEPYVVEVSEVFESPEDWMPGVTTSKTIIATNKGDVPAAVRVKLVESWKDANNQDLPLEDANHNRAAIINFASNLSTNWRQNGDYYYYYQSINRNQSTTSLIDSVTFNPLISATNCTTNNQTNTTTCTTDAGIYTGATYTLEVHVETVQYNLYRDAWNTTVSIAAAS